MPNRIDQKFKQLKAGGKKAFIAYITAGDPDLQTTEALVLGLAQAGADLIELGIPFSDPLADGTTIQAASERALKSGTTPEKVFALVKRIRLRSDVPILFMTYYNPVFAHGEGAFIARCREAGVDGLIIPDLPPEEAGSLRKLADQAGIATVFFIAPTSTVKRMQTNAKASTGFIYYVALTGVTGVKQAQATDVIMNVRRAKRLTNKPICAGFGITTPQQVKDIAKATDGVIVGSAIVKKIAENVGRKDLVAVVSRYVATLARVLK
jgi:tryptophan synthase alpha chain